MKVRLLAKDFDQMARSVANYLEKRQWSVVVVGPCRVVSQLKGEFKHTLEIDFVGKRTKNCRKTYNG